MTLIIACKCKDGIVIAADSQATFGSSAGPIKRKTLDKIFQVNKNILLAGAGDLLIIQKIRKGVEQISREVKDNGKLEQLKEIICNNIIHPLRKEMLNKFRDLYGEVDEERIPSASLILVGYSPVGIPAIYLITNEGLDEEESTSCAIGIGDAFAQIMLKDIDTCSLEVDRVKPIVYKSLLDAIETGAYGMGEPITIWTITNQGEPKCEKIKKSEMDGLRDTVEGMREIMKEILTGINNKKIK